MGFIRTRIMVRRVMKHLGRTAPAPRVWKEVVGYLAWGRRPQSQLGSELIRLYLEWREVLGPAANVVGSLPQFHQLREHWQQFVDCCRLPEGMERTGAGVWVVLMLGADWALARTVELAMDPGRSWRAVGRAVKQLLESVHSDLLAPALAASGNEVPEQTRQAA